MREWSISMSAICAMASLHNIMHCHIIKSRSNVLKLKVKPLQVRGLTWCYSGEQWWSPNSDKSWFHISMHEVITDQDQDQEKKSMRHYNPPQLHIWIHHYIYKHHSTPTTQIHTYYTPTTHLHTYTHTHLHTYPPTYLLYTYTPPHLHT